MKEGIPIPGEFYRHYKGSICQVKMIAKESETEQQQVIYQEMHAPFSYRVTPLEQFFSPLDHEKHPDIKQPLRFEKIAADQMENMTAAQSMGKGDMDAHMPEADRQRAGRTKKDAGTRRMETVDDATLIRALESGQPERYLSGRITDQEIAERGCMQILDAETFQEKRRLMVGMKPYLDKRLLHNIAAALDIVLEEGDLESQYDSLLYCIDTMEHFEGGRLR